MLKLGKKNSQRQLKVSEYLKRSLSELLQSFVFQSSNDNFFSIIISEVNVSIDLKIAKVFVIAFSKDNLSITDEDVLQALDKEKQIIRKKLGSNIGLRFTPRLNFKIDSLALEAKKIDNLFKNPKVAQDI
ncbi:30S ribosome-binding factor RbfA [Rickettsiales bacterium]|nr:30S ribosome-binding factor RbfA [Rickettsiales bacterium]